MTISFMLCRIWGVIKCMTSVTGIALKKMLQQCSQVEKNVLKNGSTSIGHDKKFVTPCKFAIILWGMHEESVMLCKASNLKCMALLLGIEF